MIIGSADTGNGMCNVFVRDNSGRIHGFQLPSIRASVTGDSLGQVASQTLTNIMATNQTATLPIFRPLIGIDKQEIIDRAKAIGTHDLSAQPYDDCCSFLLPKRVSIAARFTWC